mmetsp:Transcript_32434/g.63465  ORF Transcript_32434/g.63465 Transcript_32434/m.63465 type:complete len:238 (+) Transcript_32434:339-1052(+)
MPKGRASAGGVAHHCGGGGRGRGSRHLDRVRQGGLMVDWRHQPSVQVGAVLFLSAACVAPFSFSRPEHWTFQRVLGVCVELEALEHLVLLQGQHTIVVVVIQLEGCCNLLSRLEVATLLWAAPVWRLLLHVGQIVPVHPLKKGVFLHLEPRSPISEPLGHFHLEQAGDEVDRVWHLRHQVRRHPHFVRHLQIQIPSIRSTLNCGGEHGGLVSWVVVPEQFPMQHLVQKHSKRVEIDL